MTDGAELERGYRCTIAVGQLAPNEVRAILAVGFWLWMAWSIGRGRRWARIVFALFFALNFFGLVNGLAHGSAMYARTDLVIGTVLLLVELASVAVIFRVKIAPSQSGTSRPIAGS